MKEQFTVVESRMRKDGSVRYLVQGPGGAIAVRQDPAGNLSGQIHSGYVATQESEDDPVSRALEAVRELRQDSSMER